MQTLGDKRWCANFDCGYLETQNTIKFGRSSKVSIFEIIDYVREIILADRRIWTRRIAETLDISTEHMEAGIHIRGKMCECQSSDNFLGRLVTDDKTYLYYHDLEIKQRFIEWISGIVYGTRLFDFYYGLVVSLLFSY